MVSKIWVTEYCWRCTSWIYLLILLTKLNKLKYFMILSSSNKAAFHLRQQIKLKPKDTTTGRLLCSQPSNITYWCRMHVNRTSHGTDYRERLIFDVVNSSCGGRRVCFNFSLLQVTLKQKSQTAWTIVDPQDVLQATSSLVKVSFLTVLSHRVIPTLN